MGCDIYRIKEMNYKLEKFWNLKDRGKIEEAHAMNYKLEKFWNNSEMQNLTFYIDMNYKLEKFWNFTAKSISTKRFFYEL